MCFLGKHLIEEKCLDRYLLTLLSVTVWNMFRYNVYNIMHQSPSNKNEILFITLNIW